MEYLSAQEAAEKWGISQRRVHQYCEQNRIEGVTRIGRAWAIPEEAQKPEDPRKNGRKTEKKEEGKREELRIGAVITAAGRTDGENQISPLTNIGSTSVIKRMIILFQQANVFPIVVITGYQALEVEQHLSNYGVIFIRNEDFDRADKLDSAKLGFQYLQGKCDKVFFASVKMPMFMADTLKKMTDAGQQIVIPSFQGKSGHPVLISAELIPEILAYHGKDGMRGAMAQMHCSRGKMEVEDEGVLLTTENIGRIDELVETYNNRLLHPFFKISIENDRLFFDSRGKFLLQLIKETKSVQNACRQIAMSRGKAWDMINQMEEALGFAVVKRRQGGNRGGKTELTPEGESFLEWYFEYEKQVKKYASQLFAERFKYF